MGLSSGCLPGEIVGLPLLLPAFPELKKNSHHIIINGALYFTNKKYVNFDSVLSLVLIFGQINVS